MKKIIISIFLVFGFVISGCQDQLEDQFFDPEKYEAPENVKVRGMFAKMIYEWTVFVESYGEWYYLNFYCIPKFTQITTFPMNEYWDEDWVDWDKTDGSGAFSDAQVNKKMYDVLEKLRPWGVLKVMMEQGSDDFRKQNQLYYDLMTITKDFCFLRMVDLYNSFPYTDAVRGYEGVLFTKYDDPESIYVTCLDNIKSLSDNLQANYDVLSETDKAAFAKQDIVFGGDIQKWIQWANSIRLKFAVRISGVNETVAKEHIQDLLAKNNFPKEDLIWNLPYSQYKDTQANTGITWVRGIRDTYWHSFQIPNVIMKRMNYGTTFYEQGTDDPRLPVIALPTRFGDYRGVRMDRNYEYNNPTYKKIVEQPDSERPVWASDRQWLGLKMYMQQFGMGALNPDVGMTINCISAYNNVTYILNEYPVYMMSLAEVDLFLAEVNLKGLGTTPKSAADYISDALIHSTDFWYKIQTYSPFDMSTRYLYPNTDISMAKPAKPSAGDINTYANFLKNQYNSAPDKLEIIMQQKYIHLNVMGTYELFAELRRTRRPKLEPITTRDVKMAKPMIERIKYHPDEPAKNPEHYPAVQSQDNYVTPVFWVKNPSESYYRDTYIE